MRVGVVSDTHLPRHGRSLPPPLVRGLSEPPVDLILHLGDFTEPEVADWFASLAPFDAVAGNNDGQELRERFGRRKILELGGARIGLIHGDGTTGTTRGRAIAAFASVPDDGPLDAILYGHSHIPFLELKGSTWIVNPGSPSDRRRQPTFSFAILEIEDGRITPRLHFYPDKRRRG